MAAKKKKIVVEWFPTRGNLNEIYQKTGMVFAFVTSPKEGSKACHEWVKCRDYLHDAVRVQLTGKPMKVYGFEFSVKKNPPVDLTKMRMLVSKNNMTSKSLGTFRKQMKAALALVNHFEKQARVSLSKMQEVETKDSGKAGIFMFTGSRMWLSSPCLVSMYTFLIRLGDKEIAFRNAPHLKKKLEQLAGSSNDNDNNYLIDTWDKMHLIIKNRLTLFPKKNRFHDMYFKDCNIDAFHNQGGILSLAKRTTADEKLNSRFEEMLKEVSKA